jgi:hypothetical protein
MVPQVPGNATTLLGIQPTGLPEAAEIEHWLNQLL